MTVEEILKEKLIGKKIMVQSFIWNKNPDDGFKRWAIPGETPHYTEQKNYTRIQDDECLITGIFCDHDDFEGSSLSIEVSCGEDRGSIYITPYTKFEFV